MATFTAYKVYSDNVDLAYCGVAGTAANAYVASGTSICSDPFLQTPIATADGTDWRYLGEVRAWSQPTMTGNQMTLGGSVWGVYESGGQTGNLWKLSDQNGSTYWDAGRPGLPIRVIFYNPNPLLLTGVYFYNYSSDGISSYTFSGSNDNSNWDELSSGSGKGHNQQWTDTITTSTAYRYFKLQVSQTLDSSGWLNLREVTMYGTENVIADPVVSDTGDDTLRCFCMALPERTATCASSTISNASFAVRGICYAAGLYVAVGDSGNIYTSPDFSTWTRRTSNSSSLLWDVCYANNIFVAVGRDKTIVTSPDGITWTRRVYTSGYGDFYRVRYINNQFITAGAGGALMTSADGITWTSITTGITGDLWCVAMGAGVYVVSGNGGNVYTGSSLDSLTQHSIGVGEHDGVVYANDLFVVTATSGAVYTSPDGVTWTARSTGISGLLRGIAYGDGMFVVIGEAGSVATSPDGINWRVETSGTAENLRALSYNASANNFLYGGFVSVIGVLTLVLNSYLPAVSPTYPWAHYDGTFYPASSAPSGAYPLTQSTYASLQSYLSGGGTLGWYSDQQPYVYEDSAWTQPVLTADSTSTADGTITTIASSYYSWSTTICSPYKAMNGVKSGNNNGWFASSTSTAAGAWWQVKFPYQLRITGLTVYSPTYNSGNPSVIGQFWTSSARTNSIGDQITTSSTYGGASAVTGIPSNGVITDTIYFYETSAAGFGGIGELEITATRYSILYTAPTHPEPLQYYTPAIAPAHPYAHYNGSFYPISSAPSGAYPLTDLQYFNLTYYVNAGGTLAWYSNQRPYIYQYVSWTQPTLTTNTITSTSLGDVTATASSYYSWSGGTCYPYKAMNGVKSGTANCWLASSKSAATGAWWQVEFPYQLKVTGLVLYSPYYTDGAVNATGQFWTSSDRTTAIGNQITTSSTAWAANTITGISSSGIVTDTIYFYQTSASSFGGIGELEITATRYAILYEVPATAFTS